MSKRWLKREFFAPFCLCFERTNFILACSFSFFLLDPQLAFRCKESAKRQASREAALAGGGRRRISESANQQIQQVKKDKEADRRTDRRADLVDR